MADVSIERPESSAAVPKTFADEADRARLSKPAIRAMKSVVRHWKLTGEESAKLLSVSRSTFERLMNPAAKPLLNQDQMTRISAVIGTFKGLHLLFADSMADRWPRLRNRGALFAGRTPIETMIEGGIPLMIEVRQHVDALRGGV